MLLYFRILLLSLLVPILGMAQPSDDSLIHKDGVYTELYPTGKTKVKGHYKNNQKKGIWKYFAADGKLQKQEAYRRGNLNRTWLFNDHGRVIRIIDKKGRETIKPDCGCT